MVWDVCENLVVKGVVVVIVSYLKDEVFLLILVLYVCSFYCIFVIGILVREIIFLDKVRCVL